MAGRFAQAGLPGLRDRERCGRPASFTPLQAAEIKALACRLPTESGVPLARWSCPELAREAVARGIVPFLSAATVRRWLAQDALKPWQHRSWIFITDPDFRPKGGTCSPERGWRDNGHLDSCIGHRNYPSMPVDHAAAPGNSKIPDRVK